MILNLNLKPPTLGLLKKPAKILLDITRVDADKKFVVCLAVDDQVIDYCTIAITHGGVDRLADRCIGDGIDYEPIQKESGITTKNMKLAHMTHIKRPARCAPLYALRGYSYIARAYSTRQKRRNVPPVGHENREGVSLKRQP